MIPSSGVGVGWRFGIWQPIQLLGISINTKTWLGSKKDSYQSFASTNRVKKHHLLGSLVSWQSSKDVYN